MSHILFISDIHLHDHAPHTAAHVFQRLNAALPHCQQLYLLGDIFNIWLGEDCADSTYHQLISLLAPYQAKGLTVFFMPGNRDFLFSKHTCQSLNWHYLSDPTVITLNTQRWLLTHGDLLCTDDVDYQRYRKIISIRWLQWLFLHTPRAFRRYIARKIRHHSQQKNHPQYHAKDSTNANVTKQWVEQHHVDGIIHGHIHLQLDEQHPTYHRYVLPDWDEKTGNLLQYDTCWRWV